MSADLDSDIFSDEELDLETPSPVEQASSEESINSQDDYEADLSDGSASVGSDRTDQDYIDELEQELSTPESLAAVDSDLDTDSDGLLLTGEGTEGSQAVQEDTADDNDDDDDVYVVDSNTNSMDTAASGSQHENDAPSPEAPVDSEGDADTLQDSAGGSSNASPLREDDNTVPYSAGEQTAEGSCDPVAQSRRRSHDDAGPPAKIARTASRNDVSDRREMDDGETCSICLDVWTNSGPHRLSCLKCGHLFGYECVKRWLKSLPVRDRRCPTCNTKANIRDVRFLYARKLVAVDTSELDTLRQQLEHVEKDKIRLELELYSCRLNARSTMAELSRLRTAASNVVQPSVPTSQPQRSTSRWRFNLEKSLEVTGEHTCRVLAYNCRKYELYASHKSTVRLFPGYGIKKIDCAQLKLGSYIALHPKPIRDVQYSQLNDLTLSVSLDRTAKILCGRSDQVVSTIKTDRALWVGCWDSCQPSKLLVGGEGGVSTIYDLRNTSSPYYQLQVSQHRSPVVAAASAPTGWLVCQLSACSFHRSVNSEYIQHGLTIDGPFLSLRYDQDFKQLLVSCRPSSAYSHTRHNVLAAGAEDLDSESRVLHVFQGSKVQSLMSRPCHVRLGRELWVAAHSESDSAVQLYSTGNFRTMQSLTTQDPVVDLLSFDISGEPYLAALTQDKVRLYRAFCS